MREVRIATKRAHWTHRLLTDSPITKTTLADNECRHSTATFDNVPCVLQIDLMFEVEFPRKRVFQTLLSRWWTLGPGECCANCCQVRNVVRTFLAGYASEYRGLMWPDGLMGLTMVMQMY